MFTVCQRLPPAPPPASAAGPLRVLSSNQRYFTDGSGKAIYLTGSHTWTNFQDIGAYPPSTFDYWAYLDFLQTYNHNFIRLWRGENAWEQGVVRLPSPYFRTGPGNASDGKPKFDLSQFNQAYFDRLRERVRDAGDRGIYVGIMLFKSDIGEWEGHPFHVNNNINGINGDHNGDGQGWELHTLRIPEITDLQKAYVRKVIDTVNDLDNVLYEIVNEAQATPENTSWQYELIHYIKQIEADKPKQHPVGMTAQLYPQTDFGSYNNLLNSPADWISPPGTRNWAEEPPEADGSKVIIADVDHIWPSAPQHGWIWKVFVRGSQPILMDFYAHGTPTWISGSEQESMRKNMGYTKAYADKMDLASVKPRGDLTSTGYALANPGSEYLVYAPSGGSFWVDLVADSYCLEWFNPRSGSVEQTGFITASGGNQAFNPPFGGDAVLYLIRGGHHQLQEPSHRSTGTAPVRAVQLPSCEGLSFYSGRVDD